MTEDDFKFFEEAAKRAISGFGEAVSEGRPGVPTVSMEILAAKTLQMLIHMLGDENPGPSIVRVMQVALGPGSVHFLSDGSESMQ